MSAGYVLERPVALSCPECQGTLRPERVGTLLQYRCHIGHVLSAETMLVVMLQEIESKLAACLALLNEQVELCRQIGEQGAPDGKFKASLDAAMRQARERGEMVKNILESEWIQPAQFWEKSEP
jgi:two-component system chemotaxis response regulator CheB